VVAALWKKPKNKHKGSFWGIVNVWWKPTTAEIEHECLTSRVVGGIARGPRKEPLPPKSSVNAQFWGVVGVGVWWWPAEAHNP